MKVKLLPSQKVPLGNSTDVFKIMREVLLRERKIDRSKEHFWLVCLGANNKLLLLELVSFGVFANRYPERAEIEPVEIFSFALQKQAAKIIMVHNHPTGDLNPTFSDKVLTERMAAIGNFVRLPVIDHLIMNEESFFSFADTGLLKQIMDESHYDLTFDQVDRLKEEMKSIAEKTEARVRREMEKEKQKEVAEAAMKEKTGIAKKLFKKGLSVSEIASVTGLGKKEVEELK